MRRKLRTNSTMNTITYGFFIYVSLTTIHDISVEALNTNQTLSVGLTVKKSNCDLPNIIQKSKYLEKCADIEAKDTLSELRFGNEIPHLCRSIFETVDRICELNPSINSTSFENGMKNSQSVTQDLIKFCSTMQDVIKNETYNSMINATAHPNVVNLNKNLLTMCRGLCWDATPTTPVNSLCAVLLWENRILAISKTLKKSVELKSVVKSLEPVNETQTVENSKIKIETEKLKSVIKESTDAGKTTKTKVQDDGEKDGSKPQLLLAETDLKGPAIRQLSPKDNSTTLTGNPEKNQEDKENQNEVDKSKPKSETDDGSPPETVKGSEDNVENQETNPLENINDKHVAKNELAKDTKPTNGDETPGDETRPESVADDNGSKVIDNGEDEDEMVPDNVDSHQTESKNNNLNPVEETGESSNHDKEDNSAGQGKAPIDQENAGPKKYSSGHLRPQDDPPQNFFAYFMAISFVCLLCYLGYHQKHKIMGIIFEGLKSRAGRGRRRPNTAGYRKLDCNLEEAVTSQCNSNVTHVIY